ncbi:hypothetical protein [Streptomyces fagopyri]|uniref:hypothetical protein n=1 Tax=Streptomyces fagopyri TaxID=2662397 RepID=UPI00371D283D
MTATLQTVEASGHHVALLVDLLGEGRGPAAVAAAPQPVASKPVADLVGPLGDPSSSPGRSARPSSRSSDSR